MQRLQVCVTGPALYLPATLSHHTVVTVGNVHKDESIPSYSQSFKNLDVTGCDGLEKEREKMRGKRKGRKHRDEDLRQE